MSIRGLVLVPLVNHHYRRADSGGAGSLRDPPHHRQPHPSQTSTNTTSNHVQSLPPPTTHPSMELKDAKLMTISASLWRTSTWRRSRDSRMTTSLLEDMRSAPRNVLSEVLGEASDKAVLTILQQNRAPRPRLHADV
jgi:hypothetical protein